MQELTLGILAITEAWIGAGAAVGAWATANPMQKIMVYAGSYTSAVAFGGYKGPPGYAIETENYNGTNWTEE